MKIDEGHDERVPGTPVPEGDHNPERDSPALAHKKNQSNNGHRVPNKQQNTSIQIYRDTIQPASQPNSQKYSDFLIKQISDTCSALKPVSTRGKGIRTQNQATTNLIGKRPLLREAAKSPSNSQEKQSKNISLASKTCAKTTKLVSRLKRMFEYEHQAQQTQSVGTIPHIGDKRSHKKVSSLLIILKSKTVSFGFHPLKMEIPLFTHYTLANTYK